MSDLDFDTDGDGSTHTAGVGDPGDDYYNGGAGWAPIGGHGETTHQAFTATFDGNDNDIENLYLNLETDAANAGTYVGLFADLTGTVRNVGLTDPYVKNARRALRRPSSAPAPWPGATAPAARCAAARSPAAPSPATRAL